MSSHLLEPAGGAVLRTYRYVMVLTLLPAVWLLVAIFAVWLSRHEVLPSISDYYGGPIRDVFVGGLMACGLCMIAYMGRSKLEDYALNFAGVNAFIVALIPNSFQDSLVAVRKAETAGIEVATTSVELLQNLKIALATFLVIVAVFVVLDFAVMKWTRFRWDEQSRLANVLIVLSWALEAVVAAGLAALLVGVENVAGKSLFSGVHFASAAFLVVNLSFAAASHAWPTRLRTPLDAPSDTGAAQAWFLSITVLMWAGIVGGGIAILVKVPFAVIVTEVGEVLLFCVFWFVATRVAWSRAVSALPPNGAAADPPAKVVQEPG